MKYLLTMQSGGTQAQCRVESVAHGSRLWCSMRDRYGYRSSTMPSVMVVDARTREPIARISYNGRAWDPADWRREVA